MLRSGLSLEEEKMHLPGGQETLILVVVEIRCSSHALSKLAMYDVNDPLDLRIFSMFAVLDNVILKPR